MTRRSSRRSPVYVDELQLNNEREIRLQTWKEGFYAGREDCSRPGIVRRIFSTQGAVYTALFSVSFTLWLIFLALLALMILPGCSDPGTQQRETRAFTALERLVIAEAQELAAGRIDLATFKRELGQALGELKTAEEGERSNAGTSWIEVAATALGASGLIGGALHVSRNATRKRDLADATSSIEERLFELERRGGAT